jgi:hypothetical protein
MKRLAVVIIAGLLLGANLILVWVIHQAQATMQRQSDLLRTQNEIIRQQKGNLDNCAQAAREQCERSYALFGCNSNQR